MVNLIRYTPHCSRFLRTVYNAANGESKVAQIVPSKTAIWNAVMNQAKPVKYTLEFLKRRTHITHLDSLSKNLLFVFEKQPFMCFMYQLEDLSKDQLESILEHAVFFINSVEERAALLNPLSRRDICFEAKLESILIMRLMRDIVSGLGQIPASKRAEVIKNLLDMKLLMDYQIFPQLETTMVQLASRNAAERKELVEKANDLGKSTHSCPSRILTVLLEIPKEDLYLPLLVDLLKTNPRENMWLIRCALLIPDKDERTIAYLREIESFDDGSSFPDLFIAELKRITRSRRKEYLELVHSYQKALEFQKILSSGDFDTISSDMKRAINEKVYPV